MAVFALAQLALAVRIWHPGNYVITDIPTESDFHKSAARFLRAAWEDTLEWLEEDQYLRESEDKDEAKDDAHIIRAEVKHRSDYFQTDRLAIAHISAYTGVEHLLRAGIAAVSPFLLFTGTAREWPKGCDKKDVAFAKFHTIDAQDLIRTYNTVAARRLPGEFGTKYDLLRDHRNTLIHTHSADLRPAARDLLLTILHFTHVLVGPKTWIRWRREDLVRFDKQDYDSIAWSTTLNKELSMVVETLGAKDGRLYLDIHKRRRRYLCPACLARRGQREEDFCDLEGNAQLDQTDLEALYCAVCDTRSSVKRHKCEDCKGDVIFHGGILGGETCLTCGSNS